MSIFRVIQITLHILPSGRQDKSSVDSIKCAIPTAEKALDNIFSERQSCEQSLNAANFAKVRTQIRSEWRGAVSDVGLLLFSVSTDTKKNPNGRVRYPIKYDWDSIEW